METVCYTFEDVGRLLDIPETVLARLCHVFRLPAGAFTANSRVLVRGEAPFTQADVDRLATIHGAVMAGQPLKTIQQRFARQDAVAQRAALPLQPNFLSVLSQQAQQPLSISGSLPQRVQALATNAENKPMASSPLPSPLPAPPAEAVLAQLAAQVQKPLAIQKTSSPLVAKAPPITQSTDEPDLKALFPQALRAKNSLLGDLQGVDTSAKPNTRPLWPSQTAPTTFKPLSTKNANSNTVALETTLVTVPTTLQQAFRRRTQHTNATVQDSFKAF
jgi:hypothetical protein